MYSTPKIKDEVQRKRKNAGFKLALEFADVRIVEPSKESKAIIMKESKISGELANLSEADIELLAASVDLKKDGLEISIVSVDFSVENVANRLSLRFNSVTTRGIKHNVEWIHFCPGCSQRVEKQERNETCYVCGTKLKRKMGYKKEIT